MIHHIRIFALILAISIIYPLSAQEKEEPVVAVVLAGGGALGFAHVGALKVLEEEGIFPDMVIGTSMGSIIGGMYCVGYDPVEMEQLINGIDWKETMLDSTLRNKMSFDQKKRQSSYNIDIGFKEGSLITEAGFSQAQHVVELLDNLFAPYSAEMSFDDLPIKFRAVAADLLTGEKIIYDSGDLKTVIRASMAVPGIFTPVEYRGRYAIDGGWTENLPTTVARDMGADIVIAVNLFSMEDDINNLTSFDMVSEQAYQIRVLDQNRASEAAADLLITPDLRGYTTADFERGKPLMALGYEEADRNREAIRALADTIGLRSRPCTESPGEDRKIRISRITVDCDGNASMEEQVRREIAGTAGMAPFLSELRNAIYSIYDRGDFTRIWYRLYPESTGTYELVVEAPPVPQADEMLTASLDFSDQMIESQITDFILKTSYQRWLGETKSSQAFVELWISDFPSLITGVSYNPWGALLQTGFETYVKAKSQYFFKNDTVESLYGLNTVGGTLFSARPFFNRFELGVNLYSRYSWVNHRLGEDFLSEKSWHQTGISGVLAIDTLDRSIAPRSGISAAFMMDCGLDDSSETKGLYKMAGEVYLSPLKGFVIIPKWEAQGLLWGELNVLEMSTLGEVVTTYGYYPQELRNENVATGGLELRKQVASLPLGLGKEVYFQLAGNYSYMWEDDAVDTYEDPDSYFGVAAGIILNTILGEIQFNLSQNKDGRISGFMGISSSASLLDCF